MKREVWAGYAPPLQKSGASLICGFFLWGSRPGACDAKKKVFGRDSEMTLASHAVGIAGLLFRHNSRTRMKSQMKWTTLLYKYNNTLYELCNVKQIFRSWLGCSMEVSDAPP